MRCTSLVPSPISPNWRRAGGARRGTPGCSRSRRYLERHERDLHRGLAREQLRHRRLGGVRLARSASAGGAPGDQTRGVEFGRRLCHLPLDRLEVGDRLTELPAVAGVLQRGLEAACASPSENAPIPMRPRSSMRNVSMKPGAARRPGSRPARGSPRTPAPRRWRTAAPRACPPCAPSGKPGVPRSTRIAEMPFLPAARSVTAITTAVSAMPPLVMKLRKAVEHELGAVPDRGRAQAARVRAGAGLGEPPAADLLAARERRQEARRFCSLLPNAWMCAEHRPWCAASDSATPASLTMRQLLHHERPVERRQPRAAVLLRPAGARQAEGAEPREHLARERLLLVPLARVRGELGLGKITHGLAQKLLLWVELEVHAPLRPLGRLAGRLLGIPPP